MLGTQAHPLRLWDAVTGAVRGSYRAYDAVDEVVAATSVAFSACGSRILAGFNSCLRVWDVARPGRDYREFVTHRRRQDGLPGASLGDDAWLCEPWRKSGVTRHCRVCPVREHGLIASPSLG